MALIKKTVIYCPVSVGGIAEHIHYQSLALMRSANSPLVICASDYLAGRRTNYRVQRIFAPEISPSESGNIVRRTQKLLLHAWKIVSDQFLFTIKIIQEKPDFVIIGWYGEYLAPLWVLPHWILARIFKVIYVVNIHDPVRDFVVGPKWWHDLSVRMAYWPISVGVVHQRLQEPSPVPKHVHVVEAPVGVYDLQESPEDPEAIRAEWGVRGRDSEKLKADLTTEDTEDTENTESTESTEGAQGVAQGTCAGAAFSNPSTSELARDSETTSLIRSADATASSPATSYSPLATPASPDVVFLAFGFIRDNKNLDLVIRALVENPSAVLVVMGRAQSKKDKPLEFYRNLAVELGVQDRVKFFDGFVPDEKLASYFAAADVVVLTYDGSFHSQSGVLNVAARARRPVLVSAGESPLKDCVERFRLGVFVEPDNLRALQEGMKMMASREWRAVSGEPDWEGYEAFASWDVNIAKILEAVEDIRQTKLKCSKRK
jgi:glycosyltransferase involved in cell wall biosynthesis